MAKKNIGTEKNPLYPVTVAELIEELKKFPPEAPVFAATAAGFKPAHALAANHDEVLVLGRLTDRVLGE